jgi:hypothetical protein
MLVRLRKILGFNKKLDVEGRLQIPVVKAAEKGFSRVCVRVLKTIAMKTHLQLFQAK